MFPGSETVEGTANGDARPPGQLHDSRAEPVHPHRGRLRGALHRSPLGAGRLPGRHRLGHGHPAGRDHHIPVLRDIRQGTSGDGRHEHATVLSLTFYGVYLYKINFIDA